MLVFRGLSRLMEWKFNDINQVLRDLYLCSMSADRMKARLMEKSVLPITFKTDFEEVSYNECCLYKTCISAIIDFLKDIRKNGTTGFDNPPIEFAVVGNTVYIHPSTDNPKQFWHEIADQIYEYVKKYDKRCKVEFVEKELLSSKMTEYKGGEK